MQVWLAGHLAHPTHDLLHYRGLFVCLACGAMGSTKLRLLVTECPGLYIASGDKVIRRVLQGCLPWGLTQWPDQSVSQSNQFELQSVPCYDLRDVIDGEVNPARLTACPKDEVRLAV